MGGCRGGNLFLKPVVLRRHSAAEDDELLDLVLCGFACGIAAGQLTSQPLVLYRETGDLGVESRNLRSRLGRRDRCLSEFALQPALVGDQLIPFGSRGNPLAGNPVDVGNRGIALTRKPVRLRDELVFLGLDRITFARQRLDLVMSLGSNIFRLSGPLQEFRRSTLFLCVIGSAGRTDDPMSILQNSNFP